MNRIILFMAAVLVLSCNNGVDSVVQEDNQNKETLVTPEEVQTNLTDGIPDLNQGEKWQIDEATNENVRTLTGITTDFRQSTSPSTEDYRSFQQEFTDGLNQLVKECRTTGADHDALHVWLDPVMRDNKALAEASNEDESEAILNRLHERLAVYFNYFK